MFCEVPVPPKDSLCPALFQGYLLNFLLPRPDLRPVIVPKIYRLLGLIKTHIPVFHKTVHSLSVRYRKIHNLRFLSLV